MSHEWTCRCERCADDWRDWITLEDHDPPNECDPVEPEASDDVA
jgi:hypothetical protein